MLRLCGSAIVLSIVLGCIRDGGTSYDVEAAGYETAAQVDVFLPGRENAERDPLPHYLLTSSSSTAGDYVSSLASRGWQIDPSGSEETWWAYTGGRDGATILIGPAADFIASAGPESGAAVQDFESHGPPQANALVVVIEPA